MALAGEAHYLRETLAAARVPRVDDVGAPAQEVELRPGRPVGVLLRPPVDRPRRGAVVDLPIAPVGFDPASAVQTQVGGADLIDPVAVLLAPANPGDPSRFGRKRGASGIPARIVVDGSAHGYPRAAARGEARDAHNVVATAPPCPGDVLRFA